MRFFVFIMVLLMIAPISVGAQSVDWDKIGRPLGDDTKDVQDRYVYFDEAKTIDTNVSLSKPILSRQAMATWLTGKIPEVMVLSGQGYRQEIKALRPYFTEKGMRAFVQFLDEQKILSTLDQTQSTANVVVKFDPDILANDVFDGIYRWNADVPLMLSYRNSNMEQQEIIINVDVARAAFGKNPDGFVFDHWAVKKQTVEVEEEKKQPSGEANRLDDGS